MLTSASTGTYKHQKLTTGSLVFGGKQLCNCSVATATPTATPTPRGAMAESRL
jgi:hypothetical protein